jgi:hypothetical protein
MAIKATNWSISSARSKRAHGVSHRIERSPALRGRLNGIAFQSLVHIVAFARLVKVPADLYVIATQEVLGKPFLEHIQAQPPSVQGDHGVRDARGRNARCAKQFAAKQLIAVTRVFHRIIEVNPAQPVKLLPDIEPIEIERQGGFVVHLAETADRAFQMNGNILIDSSVLLDGRANKLARVLPQTLHPRWHNFNPKLPDRAICEQLRSRQCLRRLKLCSRLSRWRDEQKHEPSDQPPSRLAQSWPPPHCGGQQPPT